MWNKTSQRIVGLVGASIFIFHFSWWLFVAFVSWDVDWVGSLGNVDGGVRFFAAFAWMVVTVIGGMCGGGAYEIIRTQTDWFNEK